MLHSCMNTAAYQYRLIAFSDLGTRVGGRRQFDARRLEIRRPLLLAVVIAFMTCCPLPQQSMARAGETGHASSSGAGTEGAYVKQVRGLIEPYLELKDFQSAADILFDAIASTPGHTVQLLALAWKDRRIHAFLETRSRLVVVIDNPFAAPLDVHAGRRHSFSIRPFGYRRLSLPPERLHFILSCPEADFIDELDIPLISPRSPRDLLVINAGRVNSYQVVGYPNRESRLTIPETPSGSPLVLRKPSYFWLRCDSLFPGKRGKIRCVPGPASRLRRPAGKGRFVVLYRLRPGLKHGD